MGDGLFVNTVRGLKWSTISRISQQGLQYASTIILVGVLSPDDFGLMAMSMIVIGFLDIFKDFGTSSAIIKVENPSNDLKCSLFWVNVGFGLLIFLIIYFTSPFLAELFNSVKVISVLQILSLSFLITGFSIQQKALLEKELSFQILSLIELLSSAIAFLVAVYLALNGFGVWSLVWQVLSNTFLSTVLIWIFSNWKPGFHFKTSELKKIKAYSSNLVGFNLINYFARNGDYFLIGKFLGEHALGHYYLAYRIMLYPMRNITTVISRVIFPAFSIVQRDNSKLRDAYVNVTNSIAIITFPIMAGLALVSFNITDTFFGANWDTTLVAQIIIILAPVGALQSITHTTGVIYQVKGRTDWMLKWSLFATTITLVGFFIGLNWGITGVAISYLVTNLFLILPVFIIPFKLINLPIVNFLRSFELTVLCVLGMSVIVFIGSYLIEDYYTDIITLVILITLGIGSYIMISYWINKKKLIEIKSMISKYYKATKKD
ncbi:MOP flippase family protein [Bacteroidota bacterium]